MPSLPPKAAPFPLFSLLPCSSFFFCLCCFAVCFFSLASSEPSSADVVLLLDKIKPALQGSAANAELSSWNVSLPLCLWRGLRWSAGGSAAEIRCEDDLAHRSNLSLSSDPSLHLLSIRLPAAALAGSLPPELGLFSYLESLYLDVNSLTGPIPLELGNAPALSDLDLTSNALDGVLPPSIWNLCDRLVSLRLHGNDLSGSVPDPAMPSSSCNKLKVLDLSDNRFQGSFPKFVSEFSGLEELDLSYNRFSGSITDSLGGLGKLVRLNLSYNNFTGPLPASFGESKFTAEAFQGNPWLCGPPLGKCASSSGLSPGVIAGIVIGLLAGAVVLASVAIGWVQGRKRRNSARKADEEADMVFEEDGNGGGDGKLIVFQGGEHLSLEDVLNATGQVIEKTSYGTVYKAKLADGGNISLRLLREGSCKDQAECLPVIRQLGRVRHENLTALRAFYQGKRGEKLLVYDYHPSRSLHDLLHGKSISSDLHSPTSSGLHHIQSSRFCVSIRCCRRRHQSRKAAAELASSAQDSPRGGAGARAPARRPGDAHHSRQRAVQERAYRRVLRAEAHRVRARQVDGPGRGGRDGVRRQVRRLQGAGAAEDEEVRFEDGRLRLGDPAAGDPDGQEAREGDGRGGGPAGAGEAGGAGRDDDGGVRRGGAEGDKESDGGRAGAGAEAGYGLLRTGSGGQAGHERGGEAAGGEQAAEQVRAVYAH
ncbi:hypothetical protein GW17_00014295 [Ensete ventricosum]|nr:hypothetical protein GW17_00014295 [Ensete ventricosum]